MTEADSTSAVEGAAHEAPTRLSRAGFWGGLLAGAAIILTAERLAGGGLAPNAIRTIGVSLIVATWWVTEAIPLAATSLLPAALFPLLGVLPAKAVAPAYSSPFILLLLGGFFVALAVERSGAHRRLALRVLLTVGTAPRSLVLGFLLATAVTSMWISNTASTLIMLPVALAIVDRAAKSEGARAHTFGSAVLLAIAYGASVGGMGTPVGTPPNLIALNAYQSAFKGSGPPLTFVSWIFAALPVLLLVLPVIWLLLTRIVIKVPDRLDLGAEPLIRAELESLGPWRKEEVRSLAVFGATAILWITREDFVIAPGSAIAGWASRLGLGDAPDDGTIALLAAVAAFILPSGEPGKGRLLPWSVAVRAPWDLVLLFGGGIALSNAFVASGLSSWLGDQLAGVTGLSALSLVLVVVLAATFVSEIMSNTALATIAMPILAAAALKSGVDPRLMIFPAALACSCGFMLPAATGPNAIVFATGRIRMLEMVRAGFWLDIIASLVVVLVGWLLYA